ncbi:hypothetical protein BDY19DRAFT_197943 [Irpex rosettiformis]|uniref:Uncharacterized protein n=1 Tax=Irpex rosettiformis TaxID=378272 RepID=A0ACB8U2B8_9APHY|nr:hypothetical protein BDY19DRAFT_197943 [Irpex rosettiformis]
MWRCHSVALLLLLVARVSGFCHNASYLSHGTPSKLYYTHLNSKRCPHVGHHLQVSLLTLYSTLVPVLTSFSYTPCTRLLYFKLPAVNRSGALVSLISSGDRTHT